MSLTDLVTPAPSPPKSGQCLDTLEHLSLNPADTLLKKAKRKALTVFLSSKLIGLNNKNIQAYRNMYYCNSTLKQEGQELVTTYCKNRFCLVCNSIKTANLINGYLPELQKMEEPKFMTLTIKAVKAEKLKGAIDQMQKDLRYINQYLNKVHGIKIRAIRKLECNYNEKYNTYNPHFHLIIDGLYEAESVLKLWMDRNQRSNLKGQDIRDADLNSMKELFKYATKIFSKGMHIKSLDIIYTAFRNKRVVQPLGIKKWVDEDEREKTIYPELIEEQAIWKYNDKHYDWFNEQTGECLTYFTPDDEIKALFKRSEISKEENTELKE